MANFSNIIVTDMGRRLMAKAEAESLNLIFTRVQTSSDTYTEEQLPALTSFNAVRQEVDVDKVEHILPDKVRVSAEITNLNLTAGYNVNTYGLFCKTELTDDILFAVATVLDGKADWMIPNDATSNMSIHLNSVLIIGKLQAVKVTVTIGDSVTYPEFEDHIRSGGIEGVHGATAQSKNNAIITRDNVGAAQVNYPSNPSADQIVNKSAMEIAINNAELPRKSVVNYWRKDITYKQFEYVAIDDEASDINADSGKADLSGSTGGVSGGTSNTPSGDSSGK